MGAEAPSWLIPAFVRSMKAIGSTASRSDLEEEASDLIDMWTSHNRRFHSTNHLVNVLERVDALAQETHDPDLVRVAVWYHGIVFSTEAVPGHKRVAGENKAESASIARRHLVRLGVDERLADRVSDLILSLIRHDVDPTDVDAACLADADLGLLASDPQGYRAYTKRIREEFAHLPLRDVIEARISIATRLLARTHIFRSPLAASWEEPARQNLEAELLRLRKELATLPPREEGDEGIEEVPTLKPLKLEGEARDVAEDEMQPRMAVRYEPSEIAVRSIPTAASADSPSADDARPTRPDPSSDDEAECVGIPFDERTVVEQSDSHPALSAMEKEPVDPASIPRRVSVTEKEKETSAAKKDVSSTADVHATESTGTLFRPIEF